MSEEKHCPRCDKNKPRTAFSKASGRKDGLQYLCKQCNKDYREEHLERVNQTVRDWYARKGWEDRICASYRLPHGWYATQFELQGGRCAICRNTQKSRLVVDHNRQCCNFEARPNRPTCGGCARGLLCSPCNVSLGHLERPSWRSAADDYAKRFR